jgi:hypothetical protein
MGTDLKSSLDSFDSLPVCSDRFCVLLVAEAAVHSDKGRACLLTALGILDRLGEIREDADLCAHRRFQVLQHSASVRSVSAEDNLLPADCESRSCPL